MTPPSRRKILWLAAAGAGCLFLVLLLWSASPQPDAPDLRIAGQSQMSNGATLISIVLSNGTSRTLNIVDDGLGNPFVLLQVDTGSNPPGIVGTALTAVSNTLKLNLAPRAALTNAFAFRLTNSPPRFRFVIQARDLGAEYRRALMDLLRLVLRVRRPASHDPELVARSPWIEIGSLSNSTHNATERPKETPTNGSSQ